MSKTLSTLVALFVLSSGAFGQITGPASATFKVGQKNASVVVSLTADIEDAQYEVLSDTLEVFREFESVSAAKTRLRVRINTSQAGSGYVVVAATRGGKLEPLYKCHVLVGDGPAPVPPGPTPGPTPPVPPGPTPPPPAPNSPVKFIVVVEETADDAAGRAAFLNDRTLAARMQAAGIKWRVVDKDVVNKDGVTPPDIKRFVDEAKSKGTPRVFLVDAAGKANYSGTCPKTAAELIALLEKNGG